MPFLWLFLHFAHLGTHFLIDLFWPCSDVVLHVLFGCFRCVCSVCPFRAMVLDSSGFLWESEKSYGSPQPLPQMHTCATFELQLRRLMDP